MEKQDRRNRKTTTAIKQELLKQMLDKTYSELSITDICRQIDIGRRTFYIHYYGIDDVFKDIFQEINEPLFKDFEVLKERMSQMSKEQKENTKMLKEIFLLINRTIENYTPYLRRIAIEPSYAFQLNAHVELMTDMINHYMNMALPENDNRQIYLDYYTAGILELYQQWYRGKIRLNLDEISSFGSNMMMQFILNETAESSKADK